MGIGEAELAPEGCSLWRALLRRSRAVSHAAQLGATPTKGAGLLRVDGERCSHIFLVGDTEAVWPDAAPA